MHKLSLKHDRDAVIETKCMAGQTHNVWIKLCCTCVLQKITDLCWKFVICTLYKLIFQWSLKAWYRCSCCNIMYSGSNYKLALNYVALVFGKKSLIYDESLSFAFSIIIFSLHSSYIYLGHSNHLLASRAFVVCY